MKKIYALLAVAALAASSGFAMEQVPGAATDVSVKFVFDGDNSKVVGSFKAPVQDQGEWSYEEWGTVYKDLTENIDVIRILRTCYDAMEYGVEVATYENVEPGKEFEFEFQDGLQIGYTYTFEVRPCRVNEDGTDSYDYAYGKSVYFGIRPAMPKVTATPSTEDYTKVTINIIAPDTDEKGDPLPEGFSLSQLYIQDYVGYNEITDLDPIEDPVPGQEYVLELNFPEGSEKMIRVRAESKYGIGDFGSARFMVGRDAPGRPQNIQSVRNTDGSVTITWEPPVTSKNGGIFDPDITYYRVHRRPANSYYPDETPISEDLHVLAYTDSFEDLTGPAEYYYAVYACNEFGSSYDETQESYIIGPDFQLPFVEHFNTGYGWSMSPDNLWSNVGGYVTVSSYDYKGVNGVNADPDDYYSKDGFLSLYLYGGQYEQGLTYESPKIDFSEAENPILTFYTNGVYENCHRLSVLLGLASEPEKFDIFDFNPAEDAIDGVYEWKKNIVSLEDAIGESASITFFNYGPEDSSLKHDYTYLDEVVVDDYPSVAEVKYDIVNDKHTLSWTAPSNKSFGEPDAYEVLFDGEEPVLVNRPAAEPAEDSEVSLLYDEEEEGEEPVVEPWLPTYEFDAVVGQKYSVKIKPIYGDVHAKHSEAVEFEGGVPSGVAVVGIDKVASVQYFDVNGLRVDAPAKGQVVIKRMIGENGAVKMKKIVF